MRTLNANAEANPVTGSLAPHRAVRAGAAALGASRAQHIGLGLGRPTVGDSDPEGPAYSPTESLASSAKRVRPALMVSSMAGAENCAALITRQLGMEVEVAATRRLGLAALRRQGYAAMIVEESLAEADPQGMDLLWQSAGTAVVVQINFAISGCERLVREVRSAMSRREQEQSTARRTATNQMESELKSTVTGLLLESELALADPTISPQLTVKLRHVVELADSLRERLRPQA